MSELLKEECGIFGIANHDDASRLTYLGLYALQHRGQESAGIVTAREDAFRSHRGMGLVNDVFHEVELNLLQGNRAIGHVRYSTTGSSQLKNAQPIVGETWRGPVAVAHNGNLVNAVALREKLEQAGSIFCSTTDSEVIIHLLARSERASFDDALVDTCRVLRGAFSLLVMTREAVYAVRDSHGFRPLCIGRLGNSPIACSETCALDIIDAEYVADVAPGQIVKMTPEGETCQFPFADSSPVRHCIFEYIYFSRPDSMIFGEHVEPVRKRIGRILARLCPVEGDVVVPIPDSSVIAAIGYAEESGIPFQLGIIRNHYIGRTFIEPSQRIRDFGAKLKYNVVRGAVEGKRVIVVDDSIVRGTTMRKLVKMLRTKGAAREIHLRISSPPITHPCFYGIDTPTRKELIAATHNLEEIRRHLRVDTLAYLPLKGLRAAVEPRADHFCYACFTGNYPEPLRDTEALDATRLQCSLFDELLQEHQSVTEEHNAHAAVHRPDVSEALDVLAEPL